MAHNKVFGICESKCFVPLQYYGFTFVIDSDEKLSQWANNEQGNDYTSVLIKKGTWSSSVGVNLTDCGTKVVVGEAGSLLDITVANKGLYYNEVPTSSEYFMLNVNVICSGFSTCLGFYKCNNLTNCSGSGSGSGSGSNSGYGFSGCNNLTNCSGSGSGSGSDYSSGYGFYDCKGVSKCKASKKCTTAVFFECYASQIESSTYACADTPEGGFNDTTNPSA